VRSSRGQKHVMPTSRDQADHTRRVQLPDETGPVPVSIAYAETRWFGVPPPLMLLGISVASFILAIVLCAVGSWPVGLVLLGLSALLLAAFLEIARRRPDSAFTRASAGAAGGARSWASTQLELVRARSGAIAEVQRVRGTRSVIESERRMATLRLGEAVRSEDDEAAEAARERLRALEQAAKALDGREEAWKARADERIRRVRFSAQETMVVKPEPYPPPDEGDPPTPAPVPEPYPPPDEDSRRPAA
jgi:ABC-type multidrug transport system fused ATPase/permease subunit